MATSGSTYLSTDNRKIYHHLRRELIGLVFRSRVFRTLMSQEAADLMNREAPRFFVTFRNDLLDALVRVTYKFLDPARSLNQHENASLAQLLERLRDQADPSVIQKLEDTLQTTKTAARRLKTWRDKWGSHWDLDTVLGKAPQPPTSLREITDVIAGLETFMNTLEDYYQDAPTEHVLDPNDQDGHALQAALEYEALKIEKPFRYLEIYFVPDDTATILNLLRRVDALS